MEGQKETHAHFRSRSRSVVFMLILVVKVLSNMIANAPIPQSSQARLMEDQKETRSLEEIPKRDIYCHAAK